jgi:hypothetical protein
MTTKPVAIGMVVYWSDSMLGMLVLGGLWASIWRLWKTSIWQFGDAHTHVFEGEFDCLFLSDWLFNDSWWYII